MFEGKGDDGVNKEQRIGCGDFEWVGTVLFPLSVRIWTVALRLDEMGCRET